MLDFNLFNIMSPEMELELFGARASQWKKEKDAWLIDNGWCRACGTNKFLTVHHKKPYWKWPELELDKSNFITLCETPTHNCHFIFGHLLNWKSWNDEVEELVKEFNRLLAGRP